MVHESLMIGKRTYWDYQPMDCASSAYIRNTGDALQDQEYICRAPYRGKRPSQNAAVLEDMPSLHYEIPTNCSKKQVGKRRLAGLLAGLLVANG